MSFVPEKRFMKAAIEKAIEGVSKGQSPFGACIIRRGEVVCAEHNNVVGGCDITAHAEIVALREACKRLGTIDLSDCEIYSSCEPCPMCFGAIHWARIPNIVCGARISDAASYGFREMPISNGRMGELGQCNISITKDFMREEALEPFRRWSERPDRRSY